MLIFGVDLLIIAVNHPRKERKLAEKYFFIRVGRIGGKKLLMYKSNDGNPPPDDEIIKVIAVAFINEAFFPTRWNRLVAMIFHRFLFDYEILNSYRDYPEEFDRDIVYLNNNNNWNEYPYAALCIVFSRKYEEECVRTYGIPREKLVAKASA